ncbi:MAG TPA: hypothetical protein VE487_17010 [Ilumatobacter sp.]|nr:hypothetical protein [Ilumatobacter sp.]
MADVVCPKCKTTTELAAIRRNADEFCPRCDYPLFWVSSGIPTTRPGTSSDATLRRLPGVGGRQRVGSKVCPECGDPNPLGETHCTRCKAELEPKLPEPPPAVVVVAAPAPEPVVVVVATPAADPPWWYWWPLGLIVVAVLIRIMIAIF